jgi:hypothetical protein
MDMRTLCTSANPCGERPILRACTGVVLQDKLVPFRDLPYKVRVSSKHVSRPSERQQLSPQGVYAF